MDKTIFSDNPDGLTAILGNATVGIAGAGGIGSNVAVHFIRAGLGKLIIADHDTVELPNLNRQYYFQDQIGYPKVEALRRNLLRINPDAEIIMQKIRITPENAADKFTNCDILIEAFDDSKEKTMILESWLKAYPEIPIISCSGVAGWGRTDDLKVDRRDNLTIIGDRTTPLTEGTLSARVAVVAAMMANEAIELLVKAEI